jgi:gliding motility-associated-like protein
VPVPDCRNDSADYSDKNPFWYSFTCFQAGTLGFLITPNNRGDDYDWQLYDITGHQPSDVYTDPGLIVAANWSGTYGNTGANAAGVAFTQCASDPKYAKPSFAKSPALVAGHHYLLLVSHFTDSQSGYSLSFGGGTAVITDTTPPRLKGALPACDGSSVTVMLNKAFQCSSLAADGSDFTLSPDSAEVKAASSAACGSGYDMNSLVLTLDRPLPDGNYTLLIRNGNDRNTLLDNCGNGIPAGDSLRFSIHKAMAAFPDSIPAPGCAPVSVDVIFDGGILCKSIAPDGSDFLLAGSYPAHITGASGLDCTAGVARGVTLRLDHPLLTKGSFTVTLVRGDDGNTVVDPCGNETPAGGALRFATADTVDAVIGAGVDYVCNRATVRLSSLAAGITQWRWTTATGDTSSAAAFSYTDTAFGRRQLGRLTVSNGVCTDTASVSFSLDTSYWAKASFEMPSFVCPGDLVSFSDHSHGLIASYDWDFGNGQRSFLEDPRSQQYPPVVRSKEFPVRLVVENIRGCKDTASRQLDVINNCLIVVPTAFTPNGDGMNDYLYPLNAYKARNLDFRVYNRYGQLVFETRNWTVKWDGTFHGTPQPTASYVWMLTYVNSDTGEKVFKKGSALLIR